MRYRALDSNLDYVIGRQFLTNTPAAVAQAILTNLKLWQGEWFLDVTAGVPYLQSILGRQSMNPDSYIKAQILQTTGVTGITSYSSSLNPTTRAYAVNATVQTQYGATQVAVVL